MLNWNKKSTHICECFIWLPELGEQGKIIKYYFTEAKSTKQGVIGVDLSATHNDYATRPAAKQEPVTSWLTVMRSTDWAIEE